MATQSAPPHNPTDDAPSTNSALQATEQPTNDEQPTAEPPKEISPKSVFVNTQPIREEQVQNAVKFLSHPRVTGSPVVHRRNFLERKGLAKEEIDEAFRRVPDLSPAAANGQTSTYQDAQSMPSSSNQTQAPAQAAQPVAAAPFSLMSTTSRRFHWSHAVLAVGFLAVSSAGAAIVFKNSVIPRLKSWIRRVVLNEEDATEKRTAGEPSLAEAAAAAAKTAAVAAADVAKACQEMLIMKNEEKKYFMEFVRLLDVQLQEIRIMRNAIMKLEGQAYIPGRNFAREEGRSMHQMGGKSEYDTRSVRSASPPTSHPKSYMEIMATVQRGERQPSIRHMDNQPLDPNQSISNSSFAARAEPWELGRSASNSSFIPQSQAATEGTIPMAQDNGVTYQFNNNTSTHWWEQKNPRITEIENGNDQRTGLVSSGTVNIGNPMARTWVPPQPPSVFMPEAAVAIRQPKSSTPKDVNFKAENSAQSAGEVDALQRITQIAESGGEIAMNEGSANSEFNSSEIQEEQVTELEKFEAR